MLDVRSAAVITHMHHATPRSQHSSTQQQQQQQQRSTDRDSGKSSCSPILLDCSFDSGICVDVANMELQHRLKDYKRILMLLERDREMYRLLRERLSKLVNRKIRKAETSENMETTNCNVCGAALDAANEKCAPSVLCSVCNKHVCRDFKCANWQRSSAQWACQLCHSTQQSLVHTSSWVAQQLSFNQQQQYRTMRSRSEICIPIDANSMLFESVSQAGASASTAVAGASASCISAAQKRKIREYVEQLVSEMLGGDRLDGVAVAQMSQSESYLPALGNNNNNNNDDVPQQKSTINGDSISNNNNNRNLFNNMSQMRLRQLIEAIIVEAQRLPWTLSSGPVSELGFDGDSGRRQRAEHYFEPKIYQELLATAVLNKIVDTHNGNVRRLSESSPDYTAADTNQNFEENASSCSGSSMGMRSDFSYTDNEQILNFYKADRNLASDGQHSNLNTDINTNLQLDAGRESALSDYIATHMVPLPDLAASAMESEEDDCTSITSTQVGEGNWEDNWLFRKKKSTLNAGVTATGSVGMLVPAPKDDVRAQIGDKIADEISDLSEMGSDTDDSSFELSSSQLDPLNDRLLNKHIIGGKNTKLVLDELIDSTSMISVTSAAENEPIFIETKNEQVCKSESINTTVAQSILNSSPPSTDTITESYEPDILPPPCNFDDNTNSINTMEFCSMNPPSGSIAEREYKKWYNAVDMPNNPYAPDALQRRISGNQERYIDLPNINTSTEQNPIPLLEEDSDNAIKPSEELQERDYKRYSRDYYINDARGASCSTKLNTLANSPDSADVIIDEVNVNGFDARKANANTSNKVSQNKQHPEPYTYTPSTDSMRCIRSSNYIYRSLPQLHYKSTKSILSSFKSQQRDYRKINFSENKNYTDTTFDNDFDVRSQHSYKSSASLTKRRTHSSQSFNSHPIRGPSSTTNQILTQFEKQLLHKDLKRNSFRAISATTKDFVLNPLYDREQFFSSSSKITMKMRTTDHLSDSGVDSCLN